MDELHDEIKRRKKDNWFDVWFAIEALGVNKDIVESSMKNHINNLTSVKDALVYETKFSDIIHVEKPLKGVDEGFSQVVEIKFFAKDLTTLLSIVMTYGPSAIEIMGPNKKDISISEVQNISNIVAGIVHQFAAAGIGGIVITPK